MLSIFKYEVHHFSNMVAIDFKWGRFGKMLHAHRFGWYPGRTFFFVPMRTFPKLLRFPWLSHFGWFSEWDVMRDRRADYPKRRWDFSGSSIDPRHVWYLRIGRFFIGGRTPFWLKNWLHDCDARRWEKATGQAEREHPEWFANE